MKTLLFCTSFINSNAPEASDRWRRWISYQHEKQKTLGVDHICLIDDGSPLQALSSLPINVVNAAESLPTILPAGVTLFRFADHLGRNSMFSFPGWGRSFTFVAALARTYDFTKAIHIESDAFVLSSGMESYLRTASEGWIAFWCPSYERPESAIQIICEDSFNTLEAYYRAGPTLWKKEVCVELALPFTHVERRFIGDRYGEYRDDIPGEADFSAQTRTDMAIPNLSI